MVLVQTVQTIACSPDEVLEFVMDIERYAEVDPKIRPVFWARRDGDVLEFQFRPKLPGIPLPAPKVVQRVSLTPGKRIDIANAPSPHNKIANRMAGFRASFVCDAVDGGTQVTRTVEITFPAAVRWLLEPGLARRLPAAVEDEITQAKDHLERRQSGHDAAGSRNP